MVMAALNANGRTTITGNAMSRRKRGTKTMGMSAMMVSTGPIKRIILVEDTNQDRIRPECIRRDLRASTVTTGLKEAVALTVLQVASTIRQA